MIERWAGLGELNKVDIPCQLALDPDCKDVTLVLNYVANWLIALAATLFFIMLLVGGLQYLTSGGYEEQATKAKNTLTWAIVGLVIVLSSWAVLNFLLSRVL